MNIQLHPTWLEHLEGEFNQPYMLQLREFLLQEKKLQKVIYPPSNLWFAALNSVPLHKVRAVILGQDPYHGAYQAQGLSFSVQQGVKIPPSLKNIFAELHQDIGFSIPQHGCLQSWADQGILLLNTTLTVESGKAGSHRDKGWDIFTNKVISIVSKQHKHIGFFLWGNDAAKKSHLIDASKHCVLKASHPSPLSAHRGFLGCHHFSQFDDYLKQKNLANIDWSL